MFEGLGGRREVKRRELYGGQKQETRAKRRQYDRHYNCKMPLRRIELRHKQLGVIEQV